MNQQPHHPKTLLALAIAGLAAGSGLIAPARAGAPSGGEFRVNTFTSSAQNLPAIAMDADGDFVVTWQSYGQDDPADGVNRGVYAQRYNAAGLAQGVEFRVNTTTARNQNNPSVAMDADGDFVVAWQSRGQDAPAETTNYGIYAQRYNAAGVAQGGEFKVNTFTTNNQNNPAIAMDATGNFVVSWQDASQDGGGSGIYAQRFNAAGAAQGGEFRVNTFTTSNQANPAIAMDALGNFVVSWQSVGQDDPAAAGASGVYAQHYNATGQALGGEFLVNTFTANSQSSPAVAMDAVGNFVVSWQSTGQDASGTGIYAQRYNAAGSKQGGEFRVNSFTTGNRSQSAIAMDADGDFLVSWSSQGQDDPSLASGLGVYAQRYSATGMARGAEFRVNTFTTGNQNFSAVAMDATGDFAVSWQSATQDAGGFGVYAQRYQADTLTPSLTVTSSGAVTNPRPSPGFAGGTYNFNAQFCNNTAINMTGLSSRTLTLTNSNSLLNRTRDALAAPGATAVPPGGPGSEIDLTAANGYSDLALTNGECVTVPYQIGLTNRDRFNFTIRIRGDNGQ